MNVIGDRLDDPKGCDHEWQPLSFVFETQLLDGEGRVRIRQPDLEHGRVYLVCLRCAQHTYMETNWVGFRLEGTTDRGFGYKESSSHAYSTDGGKTWQPDRPSTPGVEESPE